MNDRDYEEKLKKYITDNHIDAKHLVFQQSCHSVAEAAAAVGGREDEFIKSICLIDSTSGTDKLIVAIVKGEDKASPQEIATLLDLAKKPRPANPEEMLTLTGYPCGGTPPIGYPATFLIDERAMEKEFIYAGGGSETSLLKINPTEMQKANQGKIAKVRK